METMESANTTLIVHIVNEMCVGKKLDKTWKEIYAAFTTGAVVVSEGENSGSSVYSIAYMTIGGHDSEYDMNRPWVVMLNGVGGVHEYSAWHEDDYPEESY